MTESMVERVAEAIANEDERDGWNCAELEACQEVRAHYRVCARAAIEAMREETEAMLNAGDACLCAALECQCDERTIYRAMIDEALKEQQP